MTGQVWLAQEQVERLKPHCPKARGKPRVDDRRVLSGILHVLRDGLRWQDALAVHGPHKMRYNRFARRSQLGVRARTLRSLAKPGPDGDTPMMDSTHLKAHRTAASLAKRGARPRAIGRTKGGLNSKLPMVSDGRGRPLTFVLSPGPMSDAKGALVLLAGMPRAKRLIEGNPMLPIHDSLIVPEGHVERVKWALSHRFAGVTGVYPTLTIEKEGQPEEAWTYEDDPVVADF